MKKNECDHLVGVAGWVDQYCYDGDKVNMSDLFKTNTLTKFVSSLDDVKERFYFCPKKGCGKPIDWDEIEKKLNSKKDE